MLAIVARNIGRHFRRNCVAYELRDRRFRPVAASESSGERVARPTDNFDLDALRLRVVVRRGTEDLIAVAAEGQVLAIFVLENATMPLSDDDVKYVRVLVGHLALALSSAFAFEQLRRYAAEGAALVDAARTILGVTEVEALVRTLCGLVMRLVFAQYAGVYAHREGTLRLLGSAAAPGVSLAPAELAVDEADAKATLQRAFGMPISANRLLIGAGDGIEARPGLLVVARPQPFERQEQRLIDALVTLAALAIRNVELYERAVLASRALAESNAFKDDLMAMFAHDFRGPLTVISGFSELLLETGDAATRRNAETISEQARRLTKLSEDALALAATQSAGFSLRRTPEDLGDFVAEAIAPLERATGRLAFEAPPSAVVVPFDRSRLRHVVDNVVGNALKYSSGLVRVRVAGDAFEARIEVSDDGIGVPTGEIERIFERAGRATNARSRGIAGSGVGLYIAKKIVDVHGGRLEVRTILDRGSTFVVVLPMEPPAA